MRTGSRKRLVPKVRDMFPVASQAEREVGVDGVSLGGMVALEVGLRHPEVFGVGGHHAAGHPRSRGAVGRPRGQGQRASSPRHFRLLSSDKDPLLARDAKVLGGTALSGTWPTL